MNLTWPRDFTLALNAKIKKVSSMSPDEQRAYFTRMGDGQMRLLVKRDAPCQLIAVPFDKGNKGFVSRIGDIVIGFAALDGDVGEFELSTGLYTEKKRAMTHGSWCAAIRGRFPIPIVSLSFNEVTLRPIGPRNMGRLRADPIAHIQAFRGAQSDGRRVGRG